MDSGRYGSGGGGTTDMEFINGHVEGDQGGDDEAGVFGQFSTFV